MDNENHLDDGGAEGERDLIDTEGPDAQEAIEVKDFIGGGGGHGRLWIGLIFVIILIAWAYNYYTSRDIENNYGYKVETSGITAKPDCTSLEPQNPYDEDSGHSAGFEWGAAGNSCGGNSDSFITGCEEYQNQESAYEYCLSRTNE